MIAADIHKIFLPENDFLARLEDKVTVKFP
jgi:hypothetical protein